MQAAQLCLQQLRHCKFASPSATAMRSIPNRSNPVQLSSLATSTALVLREPTPPTMATLLALSCALLAMASSGNSGRSLLLEPPMQMAALMPSFLHITLMAGSLGERIVSYEGQLAIVIMGNY